ncbi:MAG TPA: SLC13/DASS family transporter, partial [Candidatus Acetothermia bacterium]|nr:SLC13/DASS family transporter [Candidatus Acetothermia bacterium]
MRRANGATGRSVPVRGVLGILLAAGVSIAVYALPVSGLAPDAGRMLSIFLFIAILWLTEAIPLFATAFLVPALLVVFGILDPTTSFAPFFHPVIALLLGGFMLSISVQKYGLDKRIAIAILTRVGDRPWSILLAVIGLTAFLSMWLSNTATTAIVIAIILPIVDQFPPGNRFGKALVLAVPFAANIGGMGTPIGTTPNPMAISHLQEEGLSIAFIDWTLLAIPIQLLFLLVVAGVLWLMYRPWGRRAEVQLDEPSPVGAHGRWVIAITLLTAGFWLTSKLHGVPDSIIALVPVVLFLGSGLLNREDFGRVRWDVLALIGGGLALGVGMRASGLDVWMVSQINVGELHPMLILMLFALLAGLLTTFMSNTATAALLIPVVSSFGMQFGLSSQLVLAVAIVSSAAMALPVST